MIDLNEGQGVGVLVDGCRTPFQRAGTGYRDLMSYQLAATAIGGVLRRTGVAGEVVDRVVLGATVPNPRTTNVARAAALTDLPGLSARRCASSRWRGACR